jgi:aryl-alcohol dehydrogenase
MRRPDIQLDTRVTAAVWDAGTALLGKKVVGILGGEGRSESLINTLITLNKQGRFPYDRLIQTFQLDQVNEALEASHSGDVIKPVLLMPE